MQVAAHEAKLGHGKLAEQLRTMIDEAKNRRGAKPPIPIGRPRGELANLLEPSYPKARLGEMIMNDTLTIERKVAPVPVEVRHRTTAPHGREALIGGPARQRERGARQEVPPSTGTRASHALFQLVLLVAPQSPREALEPHCRLPLLERLKLLGRFPLERNARKRHLCARRAPRGKPTASMTCSATMRPKRTSHAFGIGSVLAVVPVATGLVILPP